MDKEKAELIKMALIMVVFLLIVLGIKTSRNDIDKSFFQGIGLGMFFVLSITRRE